MKIWVVEYCVTDDGSTIMGCFDNEEVANKYAEKIESMRKMCYAGVSVEEVELNAFKTDEEITAITKRY